MTGFTAYIESKRFGTSQILSEVTLDLADGEVACLLGPSGCGKTTLLSILAGLDPDYKGEFTYSVDRIAMVFQNPRLLPWRTLAQNITLIPGAGDTAEAHALLARVGLADAADQYPEKVSVGMQRRAALARALAIRPKLILMDEPLVSLDTDTSREMRELVTETLHEAGATAIISTHDRREALHLADRIVELGGQPARVLRNRANPLERSARKKTEAVEHLLPGFF